MKKKGLIGAIVTAIVVIAVVVGVIMCIDVHPDDKLKESIDNRVTALQQKQQAQVEQETAKVQAETALIKAQNEADIKVTAAKAEAEANQLKSASLTPELIQMTEAEARLKHGWVTVQGADATVVDANGK